MRHKGMSSGRKIWLSALSISLVLHLAMAMFLLTRPAAQSRGGPVLGERQPRPTAPARPGVASPERVRVLVDQSVRQARQLDAESQMDNLRGQAKRLESISSGSVDKMAQLVESAMGVESQLAPAPDPQAPGTFDPDRATVYDITQTSTDDRISYEWTFVDEAGRELTHTVDADAMTAQDVRLFEAFEIARANHTLRRLIDVVRRVAAKDHGKR